MKKVVDLLTAHCQWIALGLGGAWLLFMVWTYVLQTPVSVEVAGQSLGPGSVDRYVLESVAVPLKGAMDNESVPAMPTPTSSVTLFANRMELKGVTASRLVSTLFPQTGVAIGSAVSPRPRTNVEPVEKLPTVPVAEVVGSRVGKSNVSMPPATAVVPPNANAQPVAQVNGQDRVWITVLYSISTPQLTQAFRDAKVPSEYFKTAVLKVDLIRQEVMPDGTFGPEEVIKSLPTQKLMPFPRENAGLEALPFVEWAGKNQKEILQPGFYEVLRGDPWSPPQVGVDDQAQGGAAAAAPVAPAAGGQELPPLDHTKDYPLETLRQYPTEQRQAWYTARQAWLREQNRNRPTGPQRGGGRGGSRPGGGGGGGGMGGIGYYAPVDPSDVPTLVFFFAQVPGQGEQGQGDNPGTGRQSPQGTGQPAGQGTGQGEGENAPAVVTGVYPVPADEWDPNNTPPLFGWAHDETAKPGKTYRYRVVYSIKNPIFNAAPEASKDPALLQVFSISSNPKSDGPWSAEVTVPSSSEFFIAANLRQGTTTVRFNIYKWQNGQFQSKVFEVGPGDAIGVREGGVDYSTGWTLVDIREDPRTSQMYIVLVDPDGFIHLRDFATDQRNPKQNELRNAAAQATASP